jgi:hypothetical protein
VSIEINSTVSELKNEEFLEMPAEGPDTQMDDILDEIVDLANAVRAEESIQNDMAVDEGETAVESDDQPLEMDDLELDIELPEESTSSRCEKEPVVENHPAIDDQLCEDLSGDSEIALEFGQNNAGAAEASAFEQKSSDEFLGKVELENAVEAGQVNACEAASLQTPEDVLAVLITRKIEALVVRLVEERLSAVVERIIMEKINGIFANIR